MLPKLVFKKQQPALRPAPTEVGSRGQTILSMAALLQGSEYVSNWRTVVESDRSSLSVGRSEPNDNVVFKRPRYSVHTIGNTFNRCKGLTLLLSCFMPYLLEANIPLYRVNESTLFPGGLVVAKSRTLPSYICFTFQGKVDKYISRSMQEHGCVYGGHIHSCFDEIKTLHSGEQCKVLDVGSNIGTFGLFAAHHGCEVQSFEMQPRAIKLQQASVVVNGWSTGYTIHEGAVHRQSGCHISFSEEATSFRSHNVGGVHIIDGSPCPTALNATGAITLRIDEVLGDLKEFYLTMKVDVEGSENFALETTKKYWKEGRIGYIIMEIRPHQHMLIPQLYAAGYECTLLRHRKKTSSTCLQNWLPLQAIIERVRELRTHDDLLCRHDTISVANARLHV